MLSTFTTWAYDFMVDGIAYNFNSDSTTVSVTYTTSDLPSSSTPSSYTGQVVIPDKVTYSGKTYLVTAIGYAAFRFCWNVTSVTIPNSVNTICSSSFVLCGLTSITIPESVNLIQLPGAFGAGPLQEINVEDGNNEYCSISGVLFDKGATVLLKYPLGSSRSSYAIPSSVTTIEESAFEDASNLVSVTIPNSVTSIADNAFRNIGSLTSITIPNSVKRIGGMAFGFCTGLKSANLEDGVEVIGGGAFYQCESLSDINIPNSVTSIGDEAFYECKELSAINIPNSVTSIGDKAFYECKKLTAINISNSLSYIGDYAFYSTQWYDAQSDGLIYLGKCAYSYKGTMPLNTSIRIKEGTTCLSGGVFSSCKGLVSVEIPNSVTSIGKYAFSNCSSLTSVTIPNSVTEIGKSAFSSCDSLTSITIPNSVISIGDGAFYNTPWYKNKPDGLIYINNVLYKYKGTMPSGTSISINDGTISITDYAFTLCKGLTSVTIPNSVISIGDWAFNKCCNLTSVCIGNSVKSIGNGSFYNSNIRSLICKAETPPMFNCAVMPNTTLFVPQGTLSAYKRAKGWSVFSNIKEFQVTVKAESISLNKQSANLMIGDTLSLTAKVLPENVSTKTVAWSSNNPDVASVNDEGLVTALTAGTAIISATTTDGTVLSDSATIVVSTPILAPSLSVGNYLCVNGDIVTVALSLANKQEIGGFQTDFTVPEGFTVALNSKGKYDITLNADRSVDHVVTTNKLSDGSIRVLAYSPSAEPFIGESGEICYIKLVADEDVKEGDHQLIFREILISEPNGKGHRCDDLTSVLSTMPVILGDVNNDHKVNVQDVLLTANVSVGKDVDGFVFRAADVNKDGIINVSDVLLVANIAVGNSVTVSAAPRFGESHDVLHVSDFMLNPGEERTVDVMLDNTVDFSALQMNLRLPAGVNLKNVALTGRATDGHAVVYNENTPGNINLMAFAASTESFTGNDGAILKLTLQADKNFCGEGAIELTDVKLAESDGYTREADDASARISAVTTGVEGVYSDVCAYAEGQSIVVEATDAGKAQIVRPNGVMQEVKVNVGRNTYPMADGGIYFICFAGKTFKVII